MTHDQFQEQISRLLDNDLHEEESISLFTHLLTCHECREFMQSSLKLRSGLAASSLNVPASVDMRLHQRFSPRTVPMSTKARTLWSRQVTLGFPVVALFLCLVAAGAVLMLSGRSPFREPETVYVTRLPAVVVTDGSETIQPKN